MNLTALTLVGWAITVAPPAGDYLPVKTRQLKLDIDYSADQRQDIQQVQLCVSRDQGQTWEVADTATADRDHLTFSAKDDGTHWVTMLIVFKDGRKDPPHPAQTPPDRIQKLLVDATPPSVRVTSAKRVGEEIVVEWTVEDAFPGNAAPKLAFKPMAAPGDWLPVPPTAVSRTSARFHPGSSGPVVVQVTATDLAGNEAVGTSEVAAGSTTTTAAFTPSGGVDAPPGGLIVPSMVDAVRAPSIAPVAGVAAPAGGLPAPVIPPTLTGPTPAPLSPPAAVPPSSPPPVNSAPNWSAAVNAAPAAPAPVEQVIAAGTGSVPPVTAVPASMKAINFLRFDLQYQVDIGPSGVRQVDLYVTRDDGRTWSKWSQHDGRENPLRVVLDTRYNPQPEGDYGFRLVPVSGAGLTDGAPAAGSPPEMRVRVDVTAPIIRVFAPTADPVQRNTLMLRWEATDANFGPSPMLIEWCELPTGPWKSVSGGDTGFTPIGVGGPPPNRLANTGTYAWSLPTTLNTHQVYLKFTAWDAAGNKSEVATPSPVLVDLTKPRAKIQGISAGATLPR